MQFITEHQPIPDGDADVELLGLSDKKDERALYAVVVRGDGEDAAVAVLCIHSDGSDIYEQNIVRLFARHIVSFLRKAEADEGLEYEMLWFICRHALLRLEVCMKSAEPGPGMNFVSVGSEDIYFLEEATSMITRFCLWKVTGVDRIP